MSASYHSSDDDSDTSSKAAVREAAAAAEAAATWAWGVKRSQEALGMILRQARDVVEWEIWRRQYDAGDKSYQPQLPEYRVEPKQDEFEEDAGRRTPELTQEVKDWLRNNEFDFEDAFQRMYIYDMFAVRMLSPYLNATGAKFPDIFAAALDLTHNQREFTRLALSVDLARRSGEGVQSDPGIAQVYSDEQADSD